MNVTTQRNKDTLFTLIAVLFLSTTMIVPSDYGFIRLIIVFFWLAISLFENDFYVSFSGKTVRTLFFYIIVNVFCFVLGVSNGALDGALSLVKAFVLWPVIFFIIVSRFNSIDRLFVLFRIMLGIEFLLCVIDIWYCFGELGFLPSFPKVLGFVTVRFRFNPQMTTIRFSTNHICTHIFMIPFTISLVIDDFFNSKHNLKLYVLLFMEVIAFYLSGRIALWIGTAVAVGVLLLLRLIEKKEGNRLLRLTKRFFIIALVVVLFLFISSRFSMGLSNAVQAVNDKIINSFTANDTIDGTRFFQIQSLVEGWKNHPVLGNGMGTHPVYIRDIDNPWGYEMSYHYVLYQGGILQLLALFAFFGTIIALLWKYYRKKLLPYSCSIPYLVGLVGFIVATSVEPYMFKLGTMWIVFFPFGYAMFGEKMYNNGNEKELKLENGNIGGWIWNENIGGEQVDS